MTPNELIVAPPREAGRFLKGQNYSRQTQILAGERLSPATEFRLGARAPNWMPVGSVTVRNRRGGKRAFVKIAEPNTWRERAKVVWEAANGRKLPRGYAVHHKDRDTLNDAPENLIALTRTDHLREHSQELRLARGLRDER